MWLTDMDDDESCIHQGGYCIRSVGIIIEERSVFSFMHFVYLLASLVNVGVGYFGISSIEASNDNDEQSLL